MIKGAIRLIFVFSGTGSSRMKVVLQQLLVNMVWRSVGQLCGYEVKFG